MIPTNSVGSIPIKSFESTVLETLTCSICTDVMTDPVVVCSEMHTIDRHCIVSWAAKHLTCPECRGELLPTYKSNRIVLQVLENYRSQMQSQENPECVQLHPLPSAPPPDLFEPHQDSIKNEGFSELQIQASVEQIVKRKNNRMFQDQGKADQLETHQQPVSKGCTSLSKARNESETSLHDEVEEGYLRVFYGLASKDRSLLSKTAKDGSTQLHSAVKQGYLKVARWLVSKDRSLLGKVDNNGWTPLRWAALNRRFEVVRWLVSEDRSLLKRPDGDGGTLIHTAAQGGSLEMVQWLVSEDRSLLSEVDDCGWIPLH